MNKLVQTFAVAAAMQLAAATALASGTLTVTVPAGVTNSLTSAQIADIATADEFRKEGPGVLQITTELNAFTKTVTVAEGLLKVDNAGANALGPYDANDASSKIVVLSGSTSKAWICFTGDATIEKPVEVQPRSTWAGQVQAEWTGSESRHLDSSSSGTITYKRDILITSYGTPNVKGSGDGSTFFKGAIRRHKASSASLNVSGKQKYHFQGDVDLLQMGHAGNNAEVHLDYPAMNLGSYSQASTGTTYFDRDYVFASSNTTFQCTAQYGYVYLNGTRQAFGSIINVKLNNGAWLNNGVATPATFEFRQTVGYTNALGRITGNIDFSKSGEATYCQNCAATAESRIEIVEGTFEFGPECTWTGCTNISVRGTGRLRLDRSGVFSPELVLSMSDTNDTRIAIADNVQQQVKVFFVEGQRMPAGIYGGKDSDAEYRLDCFDDGFTGTIFVMPENTFYWNGGSGKWSDPSKWTSTGSQTVPQAGDAVSITSGSVLLDAETPEYYSVDITGGTLVFSNWTTRLRSRFVTVGDGGVVTCAGPFTNDIGKCRVWIACEDISVHAGGTIDVSERGWSGGLVSVTNYVPGTAWRGCFGWGPGGGGIRTAASHGGRGAFNYMRGVYVEGVEPYDNWTEPTEPGSGGFMKIDWLANNYTDDDASHGGGAVRIDATGVVRVDGEINANGRGTRYSRGLSVSYYMQTAGSGGSVCITCSSLSGTGNISANGGNGDLARHPYIHYSCDYWNGYAGGGGCIAVRYNPAKQASADVSGMKISAKYGMYPKDTTLKLTTATIDKTRSQADLGTLYFTDATMVKSLYGKGLCGRVVEYPEQTLEFAGNLDYAWGDCRIEREGFKLKVGGNLNLNGEDARLEIGAVTSRFDTVTWRVYAGSAQNTLEVDGNMTVGDKAAFDIRAAETESSNVWGAVVRVGGDMTIGTNGYVYAWSDPLNLGAPCFRVDGDFTLEQGGLLSANWRGGSGSGITNIPYSSISSEKNYRRGIGPGGGFKSAAGSHGGVGGRSGGSELSNFGKDNRLGATYDDPYVPCMPGSGGGYGGFGSSGCGGGAIHLVAGGDITVNGSIEADGYVTLYSADDYIDCQGGGSGGTIFLSGKTFSGIGTLSAKGGDSQKATNDHYSGTGGGGRIAVWTGGEVWNPTMNVRRIISSATPTLEGMDFSGTATAAGGQILNWHGGAAYNDAEAQSFGGDGTVFFCRLKPIKGISVNFR